MSFRFFSLGFHKFNYLDHLFRLQILQVALNGTSTIVYSKLSYLVICGFFKSNSQVEDFLIMQLPFPTVTYSICLHT